MKKLFFAFLSIVTMSAFAQIEVEANGDVVIGTPPAYPSNFNLEVTGTSSFQGIIYHTGSYYQVPAAGKYQLIARQNTALSLWSNNAERLFIDLNGDFDFKSGDAVFGGLTTFNHSTGFSAEFNRGFTDGSASGYSHNFTSGNAHILGRPVVLERSLLLSPEVPSSTVPTYRLKNTSSQLRFARTLNGVTQSDQILVIDSNDNVGIGTANPLAPLNIANDSPVIRLDDLTSGDQHFISGNNGEVRISSTGFITFRPDNNIAMRLYENGNVGIGTINTFGRKLAVDGDATFNGNVEADDFLVYPTDLSSPWPDYVFEKEYNLLSLKEVEKHIEEKGHLPNVPSAKEVAEKGSFSLGEMNKKLLEKVEELTLYLIDQNKQLEKQEKCIKALEEELKKGKK